jgi:dihydroorotate dehydrogenase (fumarate)
VALTASFPCKTLNRRNTVIQVGNISLQHPLFLAAGCAKYPEDARKILASPSAALVVGSITTEPYGEQRGDVLWCDGARSVTGFGYPNPGMDAWQADLATLAGAARDAGKPFVVNVAGNDVPDYVNLAERAFAAGADVVELNLVWPCLLSTGHVKYTISDNPTALSDLLRMAASRFQGKRGELWLKFSPMQPTVLERMAEVIGAEGGAAVSAVVCCGPYPRTLFLEPDGSSVVGTESFGQMSGEFLRPIALGQVRQFRALLPAHVAVIGVGGVSIRAHVDQYLKMGATAVGLTTAYHIGREAVFDYLFAPEMAT